MIDTQGEVSDGYHTFNELYEHRNALFIALANYRFGAWKSRKHSDGTMFDGWFIAGMNTPRGMITYHLPLRLFDELRFCVELDNAPEWDGRTSEDVIERLYSL